MSTSTARGSRIDLTGLRSQFQGRLLGPEDSDYEQARAVVAGVSTPDRR